MILDSRTVTRAEVASAPRQLEATNGAEALIQLLAAHGVQFLFLNPGTDTAPVAATFGLEVQLVDAVAEWDRHSNEYVPIEELKAANDPRWQAPGWRLGPHPNPWA